EVDKLIDQQSAESNSEKRKKLVWQIERKLIEDDARPTVFYNKAANCRRPNVRGLTTMVNSIYNGNRFEDLWLAQGVRSSATDPRSPPSEHSPRRFRPRGAGLSSRRGTTGQPEIAADGKTGETGETASRPGRRRHGAVRPAAHRYRLGLARDQQCLAGRGA